jgi:hypothetical protein
VVSLRSRGNIRRPSRSDGNAVSHTGVVVRIQVSRQNGGLTLNTRGIFT